MGRNSRRFKNKRARGKFLITDNHSPLHPFPRPAKIASGTKNLSSRQLLWIPHRAPLVLHHIQLIIPRQQLSSILHSVTRGGGGAARSSFFPVSARLGSRSNA